MKKGDGARVILLQTGHCCQSEFRGKMAAFMKRLHLIFGLLIFVAFVITGRYMRLDFPDKDAISPDLRVLMRSRHIYILFSSLVHLSLGIYLQIREPLWQKITQYGGSAVLFVTSALLIWAFVTETYSTHTFSALSRYGIIFSLVGVGLHLIGGFRDK